jgi:major membrane immunogen (membrane-anchored lipoprotein)
MPKTKEIDMQRLSLVIAVALSLWLSACSKSDTTTSSGTAASTQLNWDQGSWNQQNWQ